jgi:DNA-binding NtrC family response regulator
LTDWLSLRARTHGDHPAVVGEGFVRTYAEKHARRAQGLSPEAQRILAAYEFPGNVRELANIIERAVIVCEDAEIKATDLPEGVRIAALQRDRAKRKPTLAEIEADYIRETLASTKGNKSEAAKILGISRKNLYERLARERAAVSDQMSDVSLSDNSDV